MRIQVICLMGPTASGKTDLSLHLAKALPCEIISVDSAMVYKSMDIGTAKPSLIERDLVTHHLIDIVEPNEPYSAGKFIQDAKVAIKLIHDQGKIPVLVGGTMLYFKTLQQGLSLLPTADQTIRKRLSEEGAKIGWQAMHARLNSIDPISVERISQHDPQRIQRALEVYELTGRPLSVLWQDRETDEITIDYLNFAIAPLDRTLLHERIEKRFLDMLKQGFIEEVRQLYNRGDLHLALPSMRCVGYRQVWQYLDGAMSEKEMTDMGIATTRQLAKRQLTWLRHWNQITWFDSSDACLHEKVLKRIVQHIS